MSCSKNINEELGLNKEASPEVLANINRQIIAGGLKHDLDRVTDQERIKIQELSHNCDGVALSTTNQLIRDDGKAKPLPLIKEFNKNIESHQRNARILLNLGNKGQNYKVTHMTEFNREYDQLTNKINSLGLKPQIEQARLNLAIKDHGFSDEDFNRDLDFLHQKGFIKAAHSNELVFKSTIDHDSRWELRINDGTLSANKINLASNEIVDHHDLPSISPTSGGGLAANLANLSDQDAHHQLEQHLQQLINDNGHFQPLQHNPTTNESTFIYKTADNQFILAKIDNANNFTKLANLSGDNLEQGTNLYDNKLFLLKNRQVVERILANPNAQLRADFGEHTLNTIKSNLQQGYLKFALAHHQQKNFNHYYNTLNQYMDGDIGGRSECRGRISQVLQDYQRKLDYDSQKLRSSGDLAYGGFMGLAGVFRSYSESNQALSQYNSNLSGVVSEAAHTIVNGIQQSHGEIANVSRDILNEVMEAIKTSLTTMLQILQQR